MEIISAFFVAGGVYYFAYATILFAGRYTAYKNNILWSARLFDFAISVHPRPIGALQGRSALRVNFLQDFEGAIRDCDRIIKAKPTDAIAYNNRGYAYSRLLRYEDAMRDYDRALELQPELSYARINRSLLWYEVYDNVQGAVADQNELIAYQPKYLPPYFHLLNFYIEQGDFESAYHTCDTAEVNGVELAQIHVMRAHVIIKDRGIDYAVNHLDQALDLAPQNINVLGERGIAYMKGRDFKKAIQSFSRGIELKSRDWRFYELRATAYERIGELQNAIADINACIEINPYIANFYNNRAWIASKEGNYQQALKDVQHAIKP